MLKDNEADPRIAEVQKTLDGWIADGKVNARDAEDLQRCIDRVAVIGWDSADDAVSAKRTD